MSEPEPPEIDWQLTTFEGVRRYQLRMSSALTLREKLQAVEDMSVLSERLRRVKEPDVDRE